MSKELTPEEIWELNERQKRERVENNSKTISQSNTTRQKLAQHADTLMPGSGESVKNKQSWLDIDKKKNTGEPLTPMENFMEGLSYFTPELIAGTIGGWRHGPDEASKLMKPLRRRQERKEKLAMQANEPLTPYQKASLAMQNKRLKQKEKEYMGLRERFGIRTGQRLQESEAKEEIRQTAHEQGKYQLEIMDAILSKNKDVTGWWDNLRESTKEYMPGGADPDYTNFKQALTDFGAQYIKQISGAQVSDQERERLKHALPDIKLGEATNKVRIRGLQRLVRMIEARNQRIKARFGGRLPQGKQVKDFLTKADSIDVDAVVNETPRQRLKRLRAKHKVN